MIPKTFGTKVPVGVRQSYLNKLIDECQKIYPEDKDAFERVHIRLVKMDWIFYACTWTEALVSSFTDLIFVELVFQGLSEEEAVYKRASSKMIYMNVAVNAIKKLRDEAGCKQEAPEKSTVALSHQAILGGKNAASCTYTLNRSGGPKKELVIKGNCANICNFYA